jgi:16S rRNA (guanine527-N7)-methyltransferase
VPEVADGLEGRLREGLATLGLALDVRQVRQLLDYLALLKKWNKVYNLTAIRNTDDMLTHHLLDSLAAVPHLATWARKGRGPARVLDVGSGGGLPGMPLAIACPDIQITLVDIVQKKTAFLTQCKAELGLANVAVHWGHVEKIAEAPSYTVLTSRAFAELIDFVTLAGHLLAPGGHVLAMKGVYPTGELDKLPKEWAITQVERLNVPWLEAERHLVVLSHDATHDANHAPGSDGC